MKLAEWLRQDHTLSDHLRVMDGLLSALGGGDPRREGPISLDPAAIEVASDGRCSLAKARPSPAYQAPEVVGGAPPSPKAHIYSVGVVFYRMLTGKHPFGAESGATGVPDAAEEPAQLREVRPDLPRDLADAIMACVERDPDWRPKDLSYLSELVRALGGSRAPGARASGKPVRAPARMEDTVPSPRGRFVFFAIAAAAVLASGAAAWYWTHKPPPGALSDGARPARPGAPGGEAQGPLPEPSGLPVPSRGPEEGSPPGPGPSQASVGKVSPQASLGQTSLPQASLPQASPAPHGRAVAENREPAVPPPTLRPRSPATPEALHPTPEAAPTPPSTLHPTPSSTPPLTPPLTPPSIPASTLPAAAASPGVAAPATGAPLAAPAVLSTLSPATLRRSSTEMVEVRGTGLRPELRAAIYKGREPAPGIIVVRQKFVGESLIQVVVRIDEAVEAGVYSLAFSDADGRVTNARPLRVAR